MRRKDREIGDWNEIEAILREGLVCNLGLCEGTVPYVVPMNYGYEDRCIYFHSAREGKKVDIMRSGGRVCFQIGLDYRLLRAEQASGWTMGYRSVIGYGPLVELTSREEKLQGLGIMMRHVSGRADWEIPDRELERVLVLRLDIEEISGKRS